MMKYFVHVFMFIKRPMVLGILLLLLFAAWMFRGSSWLKPTFERRGRAALEEMAARDPKAAKVLAQIDDSKNDVSLLVAGYSADLEKHRLNILREMCNEIINTEQQPYRARLASLAIEKLSDNPEEREAFLESYAVICQSLALGDAWDSLNDYMVLLERAAVIPAVWAVVKDDPIALMVWDQVQDNALFEVYKNNRGWLQIPLAELDIENLPDGWTLARILEQVHKRPKSTQIAVEELDVYGLTVMLTHGELVEKCYTEYGILPQESVAVIAFNADMFINQDDPQDVDSIARWLNSIYKQHATVWLASQYTPLALRLHRDAPAVSDRLLEKYGADDICVMIYSRFDDPDQINACAHAIDRFGDLAIYVLARYENPAFVDRLGEFLVDDDVGVNAIPFIIRFNDDAFDRMEDDPRWIDRYFNLDGTPKDEGWIEFLPGGSALKVASNWVNGYPCEWSELGWAALDVGEVALAIASFGTSAVATKGATTAVKTGAKTAAKGAKASSKVAKAGARAKRLKKWMKVMKRGGDVSEAGSGLRKAGRITLRTGKIIYDKMKVPIWKGFQYSKDVAKVGKKGANKALDAWKTLSPAKKKWIYRGLLATGMYINITERTLPNRDKIATGIGSQIGEAAAGVITLPGTALAAATQAAVNELVGQATGWGRQLCYWGIALVLLMLAIRFFLKSNTEKQSGMKVVR